MLGGRRGDLTAQDILIDDAIRKSRENERLISQRLDGLQNTLARHTAAIDEIERVEASFEPLNVSTARNAGISVETTLRDRKCQELELLEWATAVASRHAGEEAELQRMALDVAATDHSVLHALDPTSIGASIKNAVELLQQYGAKQMKLARSIEAFEISAVDAGRRLVDDTEKLVSAVARELDRSKKSTPAEIAAAKQMALHRVNKRMPQKGRVLANAAQGGNRQPRRSNAATNDGKDRRDDEEGEEAEEMATVAPEMIMEELQAAKASQKAFEALSKDLQGQCDRQAAAIEKLEDELQTSRQGCAELRTLLDRMQHARLHASASVGCQVSGVSTQIRCERGIVTDTLRGLPPLALLKRSGHSLRTVARTLSAASGFGSPLGGSTPVNPSLDPDSPPPGSPTFRGAALPSFSSPLIDPRGNGGSMEIGAGWQRTLVHGGRRPVWSNEAVARLFQCFSSCARHDRVQLLLYKFALRSALGRSMRSSRASSALEGQHQQHSMDRTASALADARRAKEAQVQMELKLKYREKELSKAIEQQYALTSEVARLRKALAGVTGDKKAAAASALAGGSGAPASGGGDAVFQIPTRCLEIVSTCISAWRGARADIAKRIQRLPNIVFDDECDARRAMCTQDVQLLQDMDSYFLGASTKLEAIAHPEASSLASVLGHIADHREADAAVFADVLKKLVNRGNKGGADDDGSSGSLRSPHRRVGSRRRLTSEGSRGMDASFTGTGRPPREATAIGGGGGGGGGGAMEASGSIALAASMRAASRTRGPSDSSNNTIGERAQSPPTATVTSSATANVGGDVLAVSYSADGIVRRETSSARHEPAPPSQPRKQASTVGMQRTDSSSQSASVASPTSLAQQRSVARTSGTLRSKRRGDTSSDDDDESVLLSTWRSLGDNTATLEYRASAARGGAVIQVASRGVQCSPAVFGIVEVASAKMRKLKHRLRVLMHDDGPGPWASSNSAPARRVNASAQRTRLLLSAEKGAAEDAALLRNQVRSVYRSVVARAKARVTARRATQCGATANQRHLLSMMARHEADARLFEDERVRILLQRTALLERFFKLDVSPAAVASADMSSRALPPPTDLLIVVKSLSSPTKTSKTADAPRAGDAAVGGNRLAGDESPSRHKSPAEERMQGEMANAAQRNHPNQATRLVSLHPQPSRTTTFQSVKSIEMPELRVGTAMAPDQGRDDGSQSGRATSRGVPSRPSSARTAARPLSARLGTDAVLTPSGVRADRPQSGHRRGAQSPFAATTKGGAHSSGNGSSPRVATPGRGLMFTVPWHRFQIGA